MREIEVKILEVDLKEIEEKLIKIGAKKILDEDLYAINFDYTNRALRDRGYMMRVRKYGDKKIVLTMKQMISDSKVKAVEETEIEVKDFEKTRAKLNAIGLIHERVLEKHRVSYEIDNVRFELERYTGENSFVPTFLEIESDDENKIFEWVEKLGFSKEDCRPWTTTDVIKHYKKKLKK